MKWDYQTIKAEARARKCKVGDLFALASQNDPFYTGRPSEIAAAEWFAELWEEYGYTTGVHLRRVHYRIAVEAREPVKLPRPISWTDKETGKKYTTGVYVNEDACWCYLGNAGKWARYLGLVDAGAFVDRRNPEAMIFTQWSNPGDDEYKDPEPRYWVGRVGEEWCWYTLPDLPELEALMGKLPALPGFGVGGYTGIQQDYHIELWCEKTTVNDILVPLCEEYRVNFVTGMGELSITAVMDFLERARQAQRAARILYVSDYDVGGVGMPISVARKIEFYQRGGGYDDLDVRLDPIILTADQVSEYDLPRAPVKDSDKRKAGWVKDHGAGCVELDALQALHPGELDRIVRAAILDYHDPNLERAAREARGELSGDLADERAAVLSRYQEERRELEADYRALRDDFEETRQKFAALVADFQPELDAYEEWLQRIVSRGRSLEKRAMKDLRAVRLDLDDYPLPEPDLPPESDSKLYVSERDYLEQLEWYKAQRHGDNGNG